MTLSKEILKLNLCFPQLFFSLQKTQTSNKMSIFDFDKFDDGCDDDTHSHTPLPKTLAVRREGAARGGASRRGAVLAGAVAAGGRSLPPGNAGCPLLIE